MAEHVAEIAWTRETPDFTYETYDRNHTWTFEGGTVVAASAAPAFGGNPAQVDPEEAFVAALSSCHMLSFLAIASRKRVIVDDYRDRAVGYLEEIGPKRLAITRVVLRPRVRFGAENPPSPEIAQKMHDQAHHGCFIANSVKTEVLVEPE